MGWIIFALLSAFFAALVAIFGKIGIAELDSTLATTLRSLIMAGFLLILSLVLGKFDDFSSVNSKAWIFIALSGIAGALSWLCYFFALKNGPTGAVAALDRTSVVFVVLLAGLFLSEAISWKSGLGAMLVVVGAILITLK